MVVKNGDDFHGTIRKKITESQKRIQADLGKKTTYLDVPGVVRTVNGL